MNIVLFDTLQARRALVPFSYTRALATLRVGIVTLQEKWEHYLQTKCSFLTASYLSGKFPTVEAQISLYINSTICPDETLVEAIRRLEPNQKLVKNNTLIAAFCGKEAFRDLQNSDFELPTLKAQSFEEPLTQINNKWDIFLLNEQELKKDFEWHCLGKVSQRTSDPYTLTYNEAAIFLEKGVSTKAALLNAEVGPIYLGKNVTIHERAIIKGPVAIGEGAQINPGAIISNATTVGPYAKVGGEVSNSVILGYSNKAHEGFMGNSVIGEWCNLGAGTNTSNLRSDYGKVKVWNEDQETYHIIDLQFCGLFMGDHSKCGINTMFNTGTTVGVNANLFGTGFVDKFVPSFAWGQPGEPMQTYQLDKALETAAKMIARRGVTLTEQDKKILTHVFSTTTDRG
ncbi:MAG: putative sugar nucleotidyl transferase [Bacteroidota bacterium]